MVKKVKVIEQKVEREDPIARIAKEVVGDIEQASAELDQPKEDSQEFPDTDIGIDVFSQQIDSSKIKETKITKKDLAERAKQLAGAIKTEDIKEKLEKEKEKMVTLVPLEDYVKSGIYLGTKVITPHLRHYVYKRRNDGIAILNTNLIDKRLREAAEMIAKYDTKDFIVCCKREAGWKAVEKFSELTGVRIFTKKYPAGILTNIKLPNFFETEMVLVCDPWMDKNAMKDANIMKKKVIALSDTNNYTFGADFFVPCNNKSAKSLGIIFYILTREYFKIKGIDKEIRMSDFVDLEDQEQIQG